MTRGRAGNGFGLVKGFSRARRRLNSMFIVRFPRLNRSAVSNQLSAKSIASVSHEKPDRLHERKPKPAAHSVFSMCLLTASSFGQYGLDGCASNAILLCTRSAAFASLLPRKNRQRIPANTPPFFCGCGLASAVISAASVLIDLVRRVIEGRGDVAWLLRSIGESTIGTGLMAGRNYGTSIRSIALPCRP